MNFYELEPLTFETCQHCTSFHLDIGDDGRARRHYCVIHPEIDLDVDLRFLRPNDCPDIDFPINDATTATFARQNK